MSMKLRLKKTLFEGTAQPAADAAAGQQPAPQANATAGATANQQTQTAAQPQNNQQPAQQPAQQQPQSAQQQQTIINPSETQQHVLNFLTGLFNNIKGSCTVELIAKAIPEIKAAKDSKLNATAQIITDLEKLLETLKAQNFQDINSIQTGSQSFIQIITKVIEFQNVIVQSMQQAGQQNQQAAPQNQQAAPQA